MERQQPGDALFSDRQYELARTVIGEMAEGIQVLQWLFFLADRAGLFRFDLGKILVDYLGDVQVVTEFSNYRRQILDSFHGVMEQIHEEHPEAEIYIVAHSEGSVIAFLALLEALGWKGQGGVPLAAFPRQG